MYIQSFKKIASKYKTIFFDSFGVLKNASGIIPGTKEILEYLTGINKQIIVLTNDSSRGAKKLSLYYQNQQIDTLPESCFVSSGMMARQFMVNRVKRGIIAYVGTDASAEYLRDAGIVVMNIKEVLSRDHHIEDLAGLVFLDDEGFDWKDTLNDVLNLLRKTSIPVVVANSDHTYPSDEDNLSIAVGSLANMIENISGKKFIRFGKPDVQIFRYAFDLATSRKNIKMGDVLMVGDTLTTDIIGAMKFGIDSVLVLTGNTIPDQAEYLIKTTGISPTYICESIAT
jgi:HAD superfamily hydrolase (TIGR01450 family)